MSKAVMTKRTKQLIEESKKSPSQMISNAMKRKIIVKEKDIIDDKLIPRTTLDQQEQLCTLEVDNTEPSSEQHKKPENIIDFSTTRHAWVEFINKCALAYDSEFILRKIKEKQLVANIYYCVELYSHQDVKPIHIKCLTCNTKFFASEAELTANNWPNWCSYERCSRVNIRGRQKKILTLQDIIHTMIFLDGNKN
jgi:hypothetical protein